MVQVIADVFNSEVYIIEGTANSACLGGAYRARHSLMSEGTAFKEAVKEAPPFTRATSPREDAHKVCFHFGSRCNLKSLY